MKDSDRKFITFFILVLNIITIGLVNGEVNFCFPLDSTYISKNKGSLQEVPDLFKQVGKEIKNIFNESGLVAETEEANYTNIYFNFSHPAVTLEGNFTDGIRITDESNIRLWTLKYEGLEIFNLTFPHIFMNGSYNARGYVGANRLFDIYGSGNFSLQMSNFSISAVTGLKINSSSICIPLSINVYLKYYQSYFEDFMDGDEVLEPLINGVINELVPEAVQMVFRESMDLADPYFQEIIDKFLHGSMLKPLSKLLNILANNKNQLDTILKDVNEA